ncbi:hypothetical protein SKAU_G00000090 [Synaphobranchus kaupii]|uniref:Uncharacterized protein n=1 Tax=Synaphobranchus kaupii TaxID=118154 RepID=A0A9Q1G817_SYNKA|nr:hypothetical protein SKAU_G00000090 [Synaphobranchus kaupii]
MALKEHGIIASIIIPPCSPLSVFLLPCYALLSPKVAQIDLSSLRSALRNFLQVFEKLHFVRGEEKAGAFHQVLAVRTAEEYSIYKEKKSEKDVAYFTQSSIILDTMQEDGKVADRRC